MSGFKARRLTAGLVLAVLLCAAVPAAAAPPSWSLSPGFEGPGLLDQVLSWIAHLWNGDEPQQAPMEKAKAPGLQAEPEEDRSSSGDPNGGC